MEGCTLLVPCNKPLHQPSTTFFNLLNLPVVYPRHLLPTNLLITPIPPLEFSINSTCPATTSHNWFPQTQAILLRQGPSWKSTSWTSKTCKTSMLSQSLRLYLQSPGKWSVRCFLVCLRSIASWCHAQVAVQESLIQRTSCCSLLPLAILSILVFSSRVSKVFFLREAWTMKLILYVTCLTWRLNSDNAWAACAQYFFCNYFGISWGCLEGKKGMGHVTLRGLL